MAAIAYPTPHPRQIDVRPQLRLVRGGRRPSEAVYRRRRLAAVALGAGSLVLVLSAVLVVRGSASGATAVSTGAAPGAVVADPAAYGAGHTSPPPGSVYVVQPGDTLWSVARELAPEGDVRAEVDHLASLNGGAALQPGERLVVAAGAPG